MVLFKVKGTVPSKVMYTRREMETWDAEAVRRRERQWMEKATIQSNEEAWVVWGPPASPSGAEWMRPVDLVSACLRRTQGVSLHTTGCTAASFSWPALPRPLQVTCSRADATVLNFNV